ncbi:gluconokinase [Thermofilum pendens]|uniref:Carbohydrate kinase, FGGY n=1 Tax=Thermofilum pendens (strain DSM 2475 / Hrk 5) TaxID=368408 RepID=A1S0N1_THEPD|nr:gluconokinase [Thermofilum pendens]ABL79011.1 carbohydrate kinase, FGGY [Thermofilum pendens Hrk 5]
MAIVVVDIGTTNIKTGIFNEDGRLLHSFTERVTLEVDASGRAEQNPYEIYSKVVSSLRQAAKFTKGEAEAIFFTSQMHSAMILDREGEPLSGLVTYLDTRPSQFIDEIDAESYELYQETGCPPLYVYPLIKIIYLRRLLNPRAGFKVAVSVKEFPLFKLTGHLAVDVSTASGAQMVDIRSLKWSEKAIEIAGLGEENLPELYIGEKEHLELSSEASTLTGFKKATPIYPGVSDAGAHSFGVIALERNVLALNVGTSAAIRVTEPSPVLDGRHMRFFSYYAGNSRWIVGGAVNNAGVAVEWFLRNFATAEEIVSETANIDRFTLLDIETRLSPPGANGLVFLPYLTGERFPIRDPYFRGAFYGASLSTTRNDMLRAIMEGVAFTLKMILEALKEHGLNPLLTHGGGGGLRIGTWRQIFSDVFGMPLYVVREHVEPTLVGGWIHYSLAQNRIGYREALALKDEILDGGAEPLAQNVEFYSKYFYLYFKFYQALKEYSREFHEFRKSLLKDFF